MRKQKNPSSVPIQERGMKHRILHSALLLMAEKGLENTSVNDIVRAVNVTKPVLYYYFKDKRDLCRQLITESVKTMNQHLSAIASQDPSFETTLASLLKANHECFRNNPEIGQLVIKSLFASQDKAFSQLMKNIRDARRESIKQLLIKAVKAGEIPRKSVDDLSHLLAALSLYFIAYGNDELAQLDSGFGARMAKLLVRGARGSYGGAR